MGDLDGDRVAHEVADAADGLLVQGGREEQRLARGGRLAHDLAHLRQKAHVEHAVGLVENQHLDLAQLGLALFDEVDEAARGGHEHVAAAAKGGLLRLVANAAHHGDAAVAGVLLDG